jgi:hypothetical protein
MRKPPRPLLIFSAAFAFFPAPSFSQSVDYPIVPNETITQVGLVCYMEMEQGVTLNLQRLCGEVPVANTEEFVGDAIANGSSGVTNSSGNCQFESDLAADGSRCGRRAASARPGGNSNVSSFTTSGSSRSSGNFIEDPEAKIQQAKQANEARIFNNGGGGINSGCNLPTDRDSQGNLCGGRAASERLGGR